MGIPAAIVGHGRQKGAAPVRIGNPSQTKNIIRQGGTWKFQVREFTPIIAQPDGWMSPLSGP